MISYTIRKEDLYRLYAGAEADYETAEMPGEDEECDHDAVIAGILMELVESRRVA